MRTRPAPRVRRRLTRRSCGSTEPMWSSASCIRMRPRSAVIWRRARRRSTVPATLRHQELLAAKMMGRWRSGCPVDLSPDKDDPAIAADPQRRNDFTYAGDEQGLRCPLGSHLRRSNPRATPLKRATAVQRHRLLRRGVEYGPHLSDGALEDDGVDRGLINLFIQADIERQFEFVQKEWMKGGEFIGLDSSEQDPINGVGGEGSQTVGARRQTTVLVRSSDLHQSEGRRISVRSWAECARRLDRATILNARGGNDDVRPFQWPGGDGRSSRGYHRLLRVSESRATGESRPDHGCIPHGDRRDLSSAMFSLIGFGSGR